MVYYSYSTHQRNFEDNLYSLGFLKALYIVKQQILWRIILMCSECTLTCNERIWIFCKGVWRNGAIVGTIFTLSMQLSHLLCKQAVVIWVWISLEPSICYYYVFFLYFLCFVCIREKKSFQSDTLSVTNPQSDKENSVVRESRM